MLDGTDFRTESSSGLNKLRKRPSCTLYCRLKVLRETFKKNSVSKKKNGIFNCEIEFQTEAGRSSVPASDFIFGWSVVVRNVSSC